MEESPSFQEETIRTPMDRRRRIQPKSLENKEKSPSLKLSQKQQQSMGTLRKDKQLRKQQFNHRFQTYKRRGFVRKKFDIGKENKKKRDTHLKTKRDARWLLTTMSQPQSRTDVTNVQDNSFDSISDIEGSYRCAKDSSPQSSSPSSSDVESANNDVILTPSAAKLRPRPSRLEPKTTGKQKQLEDDGKREMRNMISLWEAQKRAQDVIKQLKDDECDTDNEGQ